MAAAGSQDGSEDVSDFLRRIKELSDTPADADNDLEQEILESRRLREARRAGLSSPPILNETYVAANKSIERARSLSPDKHVSPGPSINSSAAITSPSQAAFLPARPIFSPTRDLINRPPPGEDTASKTSVVKQFKEPTAPSPSRASYTSSANKPATVKQTPSRPVSLLGPRAQSSSKPEDSAAPLDKASIAQSLSQKDPAWFRQTAERASHSAALRKSNEGDGDDSQAMSSGRRQLYGLTQSSSGDRLGSTATQPASESLTSSEGGQATQASSRDDTILEASINAPASRGPEEKLVSPTKGIGGFVESARLRRNESVNKRWSAQTPAGLRRKNSGAASGFTSPERSAVLRQEGEEPDQKFARRSRSPTKASQDESDPFSTDQAPAQSPAKRFSPLKPTWIESALNKPSESPQVARQKSSTPNWRSDISKKQQARLSSDEMSPPVPSTPSKQSANRGPPLDKIEDSSPKAPKLDQAPSTKPKPLRLSDSTDKDKQEPRASQDDMALGRAASPILAASPPPKSNRESLAKPESAAATPKESTVSRVHDRPKSFQEDQGELEFRSAHGKLKRTQTQNYKAPDELKDNILRGKAGLAATGGPQKSEFRDEFKDSILRQRASMSEKAADGKATLARPMSIDRKPPTPEAIAKRKAMGKGEILMASATRPQSTSEAPGVFGFEPKPESTTLPKQTMAQSDSRQAALSSNESLPKAQGAVSGKLANRFNPALAGIIARGPPSSKLTGTSPGATGSASRSDAASTDTAGATSQLDHMTKARARGPKRRPPKVSEVAVAREPGSATTAQQAFQSLAVLDPVRPSGSITDPIAKEPSKPNTPTKPSTLASSSPSVATDSTGALLGTGISSSVTAQSAAALKSISQLKTTSTLPAKDGSARPDVPTKLIHATARAAKKQSDEIQDPAKARESESTSQMQLPLRKGAEPAAEKFGTPQPVQSAVRPFTPMRESFPAQPTPKEEFDVGIATSNDRSLAALRQEDTHKMFGGSQKEPQPQPQPKTAQTSPKALTNDASKILADFFVTVPQAPNGLNVNVSEILSAGPSEAVGEFRTVDHEISVLGNDGKRVVVPGSQQAVLCEDRLYLIKHAMKYNSGGQKIEVYLWTGSTMAQAAVEDAQLFARKYAKEAGGSLEVIPQGKEPGKFFRALGDTVITKRGEGSTSEPYMLCGRKHLKQYMAFDEVDFSLNSFSSGFPFIIVGAEAQVYLWKGKGCSMDELANAQMTAMNLSSNGAVTEVAEGEEPAELLKIFPMPTGKKPSRSVPRSAEHWKLKSQHDNYGTRLFQVMYDHSKEPGRSEPTAAPSSPGVALWNLVGRGNAQQETSSKQPQQVKEISPYRQADLDREQIYVLDAFFEIYVIVGPNSQGRADAFATALLFAQDYSILAAGSQDRPFVPVGTVVLQGAPRDLKACFRGWNESAGLFGAPRDAPTEGRSLRIVPLSAALVAIKAA